MTLSQRDRRALQMLGAALVVMAIVYFAVPSGTTTTTSTPSINSVALAEQRVARLRQLAAVAPARATVMKQVSADVTDRERGLIQADTAAQAQAAVLEVARRVGKGNQLDIRGGDFPAAKSFGDYGLVYATVTFDCHIEQLVNFLSDLSHQTELVVPSEQRLTASNAKQKMLSVRMILAGVVAKKLIPEKKGLGAF